MCLLGKQILQVMNTTAEGNLFSWTLTLDCAAAPFQSNFLPLTVISFLPPWLDIKPLVTVCTMQVIEFRNQEIYKNDPTQESKYEMSQLMRLWYFSHGRPAKAQVKLRIRSVTPEPLLFAHMKYGRRKKVRPKI